MTTETEQVANVATTTTASGEAVAGAGPGAPPGQLTPAWQDWLTTNVVRGCTEADMLKVMADNGFEPLFARHAIHIVAAMAERVKSAPNAAMLTDYQADPIRLPSGTRLRAHDREVRVAMLLANPNVALIDGLLSEQECDKLIQLSSGRLKSSEVVDRESGGSYRSDVRRSEGCHFERGENAIVQRVEERIRALTGIPVDCGEPLQMLHYGIGGEYLAHQDYFDPKDPGTAALTRIGGQRVATFVIYLNQVADGGSTDFPELELSVKPNKGSAVYFEYHNNAGHLDPRCLHAGTPVAKGDKWIVTKWLRVRPYVGT